MPNSFLIAQIERFKRDAKRLSRTSSLTHTQALDRIAQTYGYANWSLLTKNSRDPLELHIFANPEPQNPFMFTRTLDEMKQVLRKIPEPRYGLPNRIEDARRQVDDISRRFISAENAVDFAVDYMTRLLEVPRYKIYGAAKVNWEMRCWLPYCVHPLQKDTDQQTQILVNRRYKPVGQINDDFAKYEAFTRLHVQLNKEQMLTFSQRSTSLGFLFSDGYAPWHTRKDAEVYLKRLRVLQAVINGQS